MILEDIVTHIADNTSLIAGKNLFIDDVPAKPNSVTWVEPMTSPPSNLTFDVVDQNVSFWTRDNSSEKAYQRLETVRDLFNRQSNYVLGSYHVYFSHDAGTITFLDRDIERRKLYSLDFRFIYRMIE